MGGDALGRGSWDWHACEALECDIGNMYDEC